MFSNSFFKIFKILIILLLLDSIYIFLFKDLLINNIQRVQKGKTIDINYPAVIITYIILSCSLYYFIIDQNKPLLDAFIFGLCVYGIYEFTNLSIFKDWNNKVVLVDTLWGGTLMFLTTFICYKII